MHSTNLRPIRRHRARRQRVWQRLVAALVLPLVAVVSFCLCQPVQAQAHHTGGRHTEGAVDPCASMHQHSQPDHQPGHDTPRPECPPACLHCTASVTVPPLHAADLVPAAPLLVVALPSVVDYRVVEVPDTRVVDLANYTSLSPPRDVLIAKQSFLI